jgi:hypothetical protein
MGENVPYTSYLGQKEHSFIEKCNFCNDLKLLKNIFFYVQGVPHTLTLMIYLLTAHRSNDKYRKMRLDSLSRTSCTHDLQPSGNVTHNIIDVASHSEDKLRHATNKASVARAVDVFFRGSQATMSFFVEAKQSRLLQAFDCTVYK